MLAPPTIGVRRSESFAKSVRMSRQMELIAMNNGNRPANDNRNTMALIEAQLNLKLSSINPNGILTEEERVEATRRSLASAEMAKHYDVVNPEVMNRQKRKSLEMVAQFSSDYEQSVKAKEELKDLDAEEKALDPGFRKSGRPTREFQMVPKYRRVSLVGLDG